MRVKIGTPVYVHNGFSVIIDCKVIIGSNPIISVTWFHNGLPYPTRGNAFNITLTQPSNGDVFKCRADNSIGFDISENTTIHVEYGKYVCTYFMLYIY